MFNSDGGNCYDKFEDNVSFYTIIKINWILFLEQKILENGNLFVRQTE